MKKASTLIKSLLIILFSITVFLFIPVLFDHENISAVVSKDNLSHSIFLGILLPGLFFISRKIKNHYVFVVIAILVMVISAIALKMLFRV